MMLLYFANGFLLDDTHGKYDVEYLCYQVSILMNEQFTLQVSLYIEQR